MPTTQDNLKTAFAGESQANRKYLAFARKAEKDGFAEVAKLFRAAAEAETIHALAHFANLEGVGSTEKNLEEAVAGETYESTEMYPPMALQAEKEGHKAKVMFGFATKAEAVHAKLFKQALLLVRSGKDLGAAEIWICPVCGDLELGTPPDKCPVCGAPAAKFQKVA